MTGLRRVLFWMHLVTGLGIAVVVLFLALTGSVMAFAPQVVRWSEHGLQGGPVAAGGAGCVAASGLLRSAMGAAGSLGVAGRPSGLTVFREAGRPAEVAFGGDGTVMLVDGCTGRVLGTGARRTRMLVKWVTELHHQMAWAGQRHEGLNTVKNAAVLGFVFLVLSGLVLWLPKVWTAVAVRLRMLPRVRGVQGRAREWNWHHVAGVWFAVPLLVISGTGTVMAWPWANALLYRAAGEQAPTRRAAVVSGMSRGRDAGKERRHGDEGALARLDLPVERAEQMVTDWSSVAVRMGGRPGEAEGGPVQVSVSRGSGGAAVLRDQLTIAPDGTVIKADPYAGLSRGRRWRLWVRFGHTGELLGWPGQLLALLSCMAALVLGGTGVSLSVRRWGAWRASGL